MIWLKNSSGEPDAMLSLTLVSFFVVSVNVILGMFTSIDWGSFHLVPKPVDMTTLALYFGLPGGAYVVRRKHKLDSGAAEEDPVEEGKKDV